MDSHAKGVLQGLGVGVNEQNEGRKGKTDDYVGRQIIR